MASPTAIVAYLAVFAAVGFLFLFANLVVGKFLRPVLPNREKLEVYECGEPTIGSSFVQFDLRFYVVALLFIIFDVEVAFFFPWAVVFGKATQLASEQTPVVASQMDANAPADQLSSIAAARMYELGVSDLSISPPAAEETATPAAANATGQNAVGIHNAARQLAILSFADIGVFFGVLLVGFAYVWKRGDLDWVRATTRQDVEPAHRSPPVRAIEASASILSA
jgi:NADH-quinone oxidoreductase subunit A